MPKENTIENTQHIPFKEEYLNMTEKECTKCGEVIPVSEFSIRVYEKWNYKTYRSDCKKCVKNYSKTYRKENPEKVLETNRIYLSTRKDIAREWNRNHFLKNKERVRERARINGARYRESPQYRIAHSLRSRMSSALKKYKKDKADSTFELTDCSLKEFNDWLEWQFDEFMNWENYGSYWSIDHVIPCNYYNLEKDEEQYECFNWRNCRPLEKSINSSKNAKIIDVEISIHQEKVKYYVDKVLGTTSE